MCLYLKSMSKAPRAFTLEPGLGMDSICGQYNGVQREEPQDLDLSTSENESSTSYLPWMKRSKTHLPSTRVWVWVGALCSMCFYLITKYEKQTNKTSNRRRFLK